nr:hypothetical protein [Actinomycetes bacterium]
MGQQRADEGTKSSAADASRYLGRAGGLAAALALAAALSSPATSWAETTDSSSGEGSSSGASASQAPGSGTQGSSGGSSSVDADAAQDFSTSGEEPSVSSVGEDDAPTGDVLDSLDDIGELDADAEVDVDTAADVEVETAAITAVDDPTEVHPDGAAAEGAAVDHDTRTRSSRVFSSSAVARPVDTVDDVQTMAEAEGPSPESDDDPVAASTPASAATPLGPRPERKQVVEVPQSASRTAPRVAVVALTENLPPVAPSVPALPPAPVVLYAGVRREVEQSLVDQTASAGPAGVAATAAVTRGPVAAASAAADDEPVSFFANIGRWFQQTFFAASPTFSPQAVSMTLEPGASSQLFALGAQDADTETLIYTV